MEGSSSSGKRNGLPPIGRPLNKRRWFEDENPNNANNLQPQPQQVEGGEMVPAVNNSRVANRRYSQAYRHRKQNHLLYLQTQKDNLEAEIAQSTALINNYSLTKSMLEEENALLRQELEIASANAAYKQGETEELRGEIETMKMTNEEEQQQIMNAMEFLLVRLRKFP